MHLLLIILILISTSQSFIITGTSGYISIMSRLFAAYSQLVPDTDAIFETQLAAQTVSLVGAGGNHTITLTEVFPLGMSFLYNTTWNSFPLMAQPCSLIYNIPEIPTGIHLNMSWVLLADMLLGKIMYWNDSALLERNEELRARNIGKRITHVLRGGGTTLNQVMQDALIAYSPQWKAKYPFSSVFWPFSLKTTNISQLYTTTSQFSTFAYTFSNDYSLSVGTYTFFDTIGYTRGVDYAGFYKDNTSKILYPDDTQLVKNAISHISYSLSNQSVSGVSYDADWPLLIMGWVSFKENTTNYDCNEFRDALLFLRWVYTDDQAEDVIESAGFFLPSEDQIIDIVNFLDKVTCGGKVMLQVATPEPDKVGKIVITVVYWIMVVVCVVLLTMINYKRPVAKIYALILVFGLVLCGISMALFTFVPVSNELCISRWWLMGIGMVIFSGGVFCRSYQLKKIHQLIKSGRYQKTKNFDHMKLLATAMGIITGVEVIILIILQFTTPFVSEVEVTNVVTRLGEYHCHNDNAILWVSIQSAYLVCILLMGIYSMYSTWKISSSVDDTRINILMIFLCLVALAVSGVVWGYSGHKESSDSWWGLSLILIWAVCMMCSVFIPKFVKARKESSSSVSDKTTKSVTHTSTL